MREKCCSIAGFRCLHQHMHDNKIRIYSNKLQFLWLRPLFHVAAFATRLFCIAWIHGARPRIYSTFSTHQFLLEKRVYSAVDDFNLYYSRMHCTISVVCSLYAVTVLVVCRWLLNINIQWLSWSLHIGVHACVSCVSFDNVSVHFTFRFINSISCHSVVIGCWRLLMYLHPKKM